MRMITPFWWSLLLAADSIHAFDIISVILLVMYILGNACGMWEVLKVNPHTKVEIKDGSDSSALACFQGSKSLTNSSCNHVSDSPGFSVVEC